MTETNKPDFTVNDAVEIVSAYVSNNFVPISELPNLIGGVHAALQGLGKPAPVAVAAAVPLKPAVAINKSITDDYLVCLEDGQKFKSLKRHLMSSYGLSPEQYRTKWNLPKSYPMVAPAYADKRSKLALSLGLGRSRTNSEGKAVGQTGAAIN